MASNYWDRDALGIATMIFAPYKNKTVSFIFYAALILFKMSLIADPNMLVADATSLKDYDSKYKNTIIARNNILVSLLKIPDIVTYLKDNTEALVYILLAVSLLWLLLCSFTLINFTRFKKWTSDKPDHRPEMPFYFKLLTAMVYNFDYFFIIIVNMFIQSITCIKYPAEVASNATNNGIVKVGEERSTGASTAITYIRACGLNRGIGCLDLNHYFVCFLGAILMICNLWIKLCSHLVLSHSPQPSILFSQYGILGLVHIFMIIGMLITKSYILNMSTVSSSTVDYYFVGCLCALVADLCIHNIFMPFYSETINKLRLGEDIAMLMLTVIILLLRNTNLHLVHSVNYSLVFACLLFVALFKLAQNFQSQRASLKLIENTNDTTASDLSRIAYKGLQFLENSMAEKNNLDSSQLQTLVFFLNLQKMKNRDTYLKNLKVKEVAINPLLSMLKMKMKKTGILNSRSEHKEHPNDQLQDAPEYVSKQSSDYHSSEHDINKPQFTRIGGLTLKRDGTLKPPSRSEQEESEQAYPVQPSHGSFTKVGRLFQTKNVAHKMTKQLTIAEARRGSTHKRMTMMNAIMKDQFKKDGAVKDSEASPMKSEVSERYDVEPEINLDSKEMRTFLIDKFEELKDTNTRDILMLVSNMTEECFDRLSKSSTVSLSTIRELLTISVTLCLDYLGNIPLAMLKLYQTQQLFKRSKLVSKKPNKDHGYKMYDSQQSVISNSLRLEVIRSLISLSLRHNSQTGELVLRDVRSGLINKEKEESNLRLFRLLDFINCYKECKENIKKAVTIKNSLLNDMAENKIVNYEVVYKASTRFNRITEKVTIDMEHLKELATPAFTSLILVEGYYLAYLHQDIKRGRGMIEKMLALGISTNYNHINFDAKRLHKLEEKVIIGASGEVLSFHEINLASSNAKIYLGFSSPQLLEKDLSVIIPEPIKSRHAQMLNFKEANGSLLESSGTIPVIALDSDGLASMCRLAVKLNYLLDSGLQFLGSLDFALIDKESCFVLLDQQCNITNISFDAHRYLEPNTDLTKYDANIVANFKDFNKVANFISMNGKMDVEELMNNPKIFPFSKQYYDMCLGKEAEILDKTKKWRKIQYLVNDYYIYRLGVILRCFHFTPGKARISMIELGKLVVNQMASKMSVKHYSTTNNDVIDRFSDGGVSTILDSLNEDECLRLAAKLASEHRRQDRVIDILNAIERKFDLIELVGNEIMPLKGESQHNSSSESAGEDDQPREELVPLRSFQKSMELHQITHNLDNMMRFCLYFDLWYKEKIQKIKKEIIKDIFNFKGLFAKKIALNHLKNIAKHAINIKKEIQLAVILPKEAGQGERTKYKLSRIILNKLNYNFINLKTVFFFLIFFFCICGQFAIGYFKFYLGMLVNSEVRHKLLASDLNSWVVWSTSNLILLADTSRAVYEGYLPNEAYMYWGGADILRANTALKSSMKGTLQGISLQYRFIMQNVTMAMFHDADRYLKYQTVQTWNPGNIDWKNPPSAVQWRQEFLNLYEAISFSAPISEKYINRNDSEYLASQIGYNRNKDLLAEFIRLNLGNQLLEIVMEDGLDIEKYFMNICKFNAFLSTYGDVLQLIMMVLVANIILIMLFLTKSKMSAFYELLFEFKVKSLKKAQRCTNRG